MNELALGTAVNDLLSDNRKEALVSLRAFSSGVTTLKDEIKLLVQLARQPE